MAMAFPIPDHLPRAGALAQQNKTAQILSKVAEATTKTLTVEVAGDWRTELDESIRETKDRLQVRINEQLPAFNQQFASAKSVQRRLRDLSENAYRLSDRLSNPETGLIPTLVKGLSEHSALAQQTLDARVLYCALEHLSKCDEEFRSLVQLVEEGKLAEAVVFCKTVQELVDSSPEPLGKAVVLEDLKRKFFALQYRVEEQLSDAYSRSVRISSSELAICSAVQVRQANAVISLSEILPSVAQTSLSTMLSALRRDIISYFIESPLQQPMSANVLKTKTARGSPGHTLSLFPAAGLDLRTTALVCLSELLSFLSQYLFPSLPKAERISFPNSLCKPITSAVLNHLLISHIPSALKALPAFISLLTAATQFELDMVAPLIEDSRRELEVKVWAANVGKHYGRKRRTDILQDARKIASSTTDEGTFAVEVEDTSEPKVEVSASTLPDVVAVQGDDNVAEEDGWGFGDEPMEDASEELPKPEEVPEDNAWDLDPEPPETPMTSTSSIDVEPPSAVGDLDADDAWGLGDDVGEPPSVSAETESKSENTDETAWDDPWDEPPAPKVTPPSPPPIPSPLFKQPKVATRLEKLAAKTKSPSSTNGSARASPTVSSPLSPYSAALPLSAKSPLSMSMKSPLSMGSPYSPQHDDWNPPKQELPKPVSPPPKPRKKEKYLVSIRAKKIFSLVEDVLAEGRDLALSHIFDQISSDSTGQPSGLSSSSTASASLILQSAPLTLDLYRAVYPIVFAADLARKPALVMRFSNDCLYLGEEVKKLLWRIKRAPLPGDESRQIETQLQETGERLANYGDWLFDDSVDKQRTRIIALLDRAQGFVETADQDRFDECEMAVGDVLRESLALGNQWKPIITRTKYYNSIGRIVEGVLDRLLRNVLGLPDITAAESHKLSELCRILNSLERLFIDTDDVEAASMVVAHVPSWLKFSYLSELLEASMADISYLFEEGDLIDFSVEELTGLVRALFADTPLRANTIAKFMGGHPPRH